MASTTNFNWSTPDDTSLVKDGAAAIRTLGQSIDTSMAELKGGTTGQVLSKTSNTDMDFTWVAADDSNAIQNAIVDAKGDLIAATANDTPARLAVGNNGETLVADSSTSTGLSYQANFAAGKNRIINGDFRINQRGFTSSTSQGYGFDRWRSTTSGGTVTYSAQTFTAGTAPVAGYEGTNFARMLTASQSAAGDYAIFLQPMEDCRLFAGQTITVSFWAKAASGTPKVAVEFVQNFGSGGSADVNTYAGQVTLSTSWARYSVTGTVPSISGKTIGAGSSLSAYMWSSAGSTYNSRTGSIGIQNNTVDYWGVQIEAGSVATAFQTATGTIQGELAACQRYYYRLSAAAGYPAMPFGYGPAPTSTLASPYVQFPVQMRRDPTSVDYANIGVSDIVTGAITVTSLAVSTNLGGVLGCILDAFVASGLTTYRSYALVSRNSSAYLGFSAEL